VQVEMDPSGSFAETPSRELFRDTAQIIGHIDTREVAGHMFQQLVDLKGDPRIMCNSGSLQKNGVLITGRGITLYPLARVVMKDEEMFIYDKDSVSVRMVIDSSWSLCHFNYTN